MEYKIKQGDTLYSIVRRKYAQYCYENNIKLTEVVDKVKEYNNIQNTQNLQIGDIIKLPDIEKLNLFAKPSQETLDYNAKEFLYTLKEGNPDFLIFSIKSLVQTKRKEDIFVQGNKIIYNLKNTWEKIDPKYIINSLKKYQEYGQDIIDYNKIEYNVIGDKVAITLPLKEGKLSDYIQVESEKKEAVDYAITNSLI